MQPLLTTDKKKAPASARARTPRRRLQELHSTTLTATASYSPYGHQTSRKHDISRIVCSSTTEFDTKRLVSYPTFLVADYTDVLRHIYHWSIDDITRKTGMVSLPMRGKHLERYPNDRVVLRLIMALDELGYFRERELSFADHEYRKQLKLPAPVTVLRLIIGELFNTGFMFVVRKLRQVLDVPVESINIQFTERGIRDESCFIRRTGCTFNKTSDFSFIEVVGNFQAYTNKTHNASTQTAIGEALDDNGAG